MTTLINTINTINTINKMKISTDDAAELAAIKAVERQEPLLAITSKSRFVMFPLSYDDMFDMYKKHCASYWVADEISFAQDLIDFLKLKEHEQYFINHILAFFAASDGIVTLNLAQRFLVEVPHAEANAFYGFQIAIEQVHSETYSLLINTYEKDVEKQNKLFNAVTNFPAIKEKADWAVKWIDDQDAPFAQRIVAFVIVEGLMFSSSFCAIFWLRSRGLLPGLTFANQLISRDETLHTDFGALLYSKLERKLPQAVVRAMMEEAVDIERRFITEAIPCSMIGMNSEKMTEYIHFIADRLMVQLGCDKIYQANNPFDFMEYASLECRVNMFEGRNASYSKAGVGLTPGQSSVPDKLIIDSNADF